MDAKSNAVVITTAMVMEGLMTGERCKINLADPELCRYISLYLHNFIVEVLGQENVPYTPIKDI